jgi:hypothetical protein
MQSAGPGEVSEASLKPVNAGDIAVYQKQIRVSVLRANPDTLDNARLVVRVENNTKSAVAKIHLVVHKASDMKKKNPPVIGDGEVTDLDVGESKTVSIPTIVPITDKVLTDMSLTVDKVWLNR